MILVSSCTSPNPKQNYPVFLFSDYTGMTYGHNNTHGDTACDRNKQCPFVHSRIVGGSDVDIEDYPYIVSTFHLVPISKNAWSYTSTPQYAFMAWCSLKKLHTDNCTFTYFILVEMESCVVEVVLSLWFPTEVRLSQGVCQHNTKQMKQ
jgi:hypothetical protein